MNHQEAIKILNLTNKYTEEDLNKSFKNLSKKYHPDINKEPNSENKYKEISEAYHFLKENKKDNKYFNSDDINSTFNADYIKRPFRSDFKVDFYNFNMNENDFINFAVGIKDNVSYCENIKINISFLEAIKGCSKEIKYKKKNFKNEITEIKVKLNIKPGIENGAYLLQKTAGSYNETTRKYNDIKFIFEVEKHPILNRNGYNIESSIHISLLQALRGDTIEIDTINGLQKINLKPLLKNKDRVILKEKGIILDSIKGDHIITVNVTYPDDVQPLINLLEGQK